MNNYILYEITLLAALFITQYCAGLLVLHLGVKVNYTRKIGHFSLFFFPLFLMAVFPYESTFARFLIDSGIAILSLAIYLGPLRERSAIIAIMFTSFDRPEDRPNTLWWFFTQTVAGYMVLIPAVIIFWTNDLAELIWIPLLINGIGDGLAEPVGVRFGRHKYQTYAFFSKKKYVRTLEGSACVFIASLLVIIGFHSAFTQTQFLIALALIPPS
uniref:Phytol kinase n=1 Tax=Candidatus Kentrum sp. SD TaxID=2126332 RepID=A0A450Z7Z6_9GAMM|nr:MAG: phytol kinase [Candidatus Kentron sp. SD]VFK49905.1 MAG: phytol kinase [Candidatus Kentron sp. SD]